MVNTWIRIQQFPRKVTTHAGAMQSAASSDHVTLATQCA
jgi:hypothetical protein